MKKEEKVSINFNTIWETDYWMHSNDMYCGFNMPPALISQKENKDEYSHQLPPYAKRKFYLSDEYPAVPKNWVPSTGRKTSYFVAVKENQGMWLDFNKNYEHKYDVAIAISIQGINPITGMPCTSAALPCTRGGQSCSQSQSAPTTPIIRSRTDTTSRSMVLTGPALLSTTAATILCLWMVMPNGSRCPSISGALIMATTRLANGILRDKFIGFLAAPAVRPARRGDEAHPPDRDRPGARPLR